MLTRIVQSMLGARLGPRPFAIVSNNCWGAHVYQSSGLPFNTPFIGLFLAPQDYIDLLGDFRNLVRQPLRFRERSRHDYINELRDREHSTYPIGVLGDEIEIQFLHYPTIDEARAKWDRRVARLPAEDRDLFFKFCDRDGCTERQIIAFDGSPFANKVVFVSRRHEGVRHQIIVPGVGHQVPDGLSLSRISYRYFDAAGWIGNAAGVSPMFRWPRA